MSFRYLPCLRIGIPRICPAGIWGRGRADFPRAPQLGRAEEAPHRTPLAAGRDPTSSIRASICQRPALRQAAFYERRKIHDLLLEGVELALKKRGYPALGKVAAQGTLSLSPLSPELGALETQLAKNLLSIGLGHTPGAAAG